MVSLELRERTDEQTDKQTNRSEFIGPVYSGEPVKQQKIKTRIRNNVMHLHYCQSQLIRKLCFIGPSKLYPYHYINNHPLKAPSNYMKQSPRLSRHFGYCSREIVNHETRCTQSTCRQCHSSGMPRMGDKERAGVKKLMDIAYLLH